MKRLQTRNTIKTALNIYRDRFGEYYRLALINSFWIFVPIYGWAKYAAMMGLLARLTYGDVSGNTETIRAAKRFIKPKTWSFFGAGLMASLIFILKSLRMSIVVIILLWVASQYNIVIVSVYVNVILLSLIFFSAFYYYPYWLTSHLFLYELPLAITQNINVAQSRNIGWQLAENKSAHQLKTILFCFISLISLPYLFFQQIYSFEGFSIISQSIDSLLKLFSFDIYGFLGSFLSFFSLSFEFFTVSLLMPILSIVIRVFTSIILHVHIPIPDSNPVLSLLRIALIAVLFSVFRALLIPFWQSLKAVTYYRLNLIEEELNS